MTALFQNGVNYQMNGMNMMNIMKGGHDMEIFGAFIAGVLVGCAAVATWLGHIIMKEDKGSDDIL